MDNCGAPVLVSCKPLKPEFKKLKKITLAHEYFTIGRGLTNSVVIPFLAISRNHCIFKKANNKWSIEDKSTFGIKINDININKGAKKLLSHGDIITFEPSQEFVYQFLTNSDHEYDVPRKRIKREMDTDSDLINNVKVKFEESQSNEMKHIEERIENAKLMENTLLILKQLSESDMNRQLKQLKNQFAIQIENLKGKKNEVAKQKTLLMEERDAQLSTIKVEMEGKIAGIMEQIDKHNETESKLINENKLLKEKMLKEREEFLAELNRASSSKQDMLKKLEAKMREQEEIRLKEKQALKDMLQKETEQLRLAKERELKELEEQKILQEIQLKHDYFELKCLIDEQMKKSAENRLKAEQDLNMEMEQMKKLSHQDKAKMNLLVQEKEEIEKKLQEAKIEAKKYADELKARVLERETELAALAAERIQKQAEQSGEVISTLQQQLENVRKELKAVESEKNTLVENLGVMEGPSPSTSKQSMLNEVGELMESELQCSVCAELFVEATTLNCSHTFCKYCITMWKKKKKDCPICRMPITTECRSLVVDSFIDKMVQNLTEEMKAKRRDILKNRADEVTVMMKPQTKTRTPTRRRGRRRRTTTTPSIQTVDLTMTPSTTTSSSSQTTRNLVQLTLTDAASIQTVDLTTAPSTMTSDSTQPPQDTQDSVQLTLTDAASIQTVDLTTAPSTMTANSSQLPQDLVQLTLTDSASIQTVDLTAAPSVTTNSSELSQDLVYLSLTDAGTFEEHPVATAEASITVSLEATTPNPRE